ncbi:MAG: DoxX family protein [Sulfurimonas sp.]
MLLQPDLAKLLLRVSLGILILFHGIHKVIHGISGIKSMMDASIFPGFFAYGVFVGELIAPIFIILGLYARVAAGVLAFNMFMAIYLAYGFSLTLSKHGGLTWELPFVYLLMSILVILLGSGKYGVNSK